MNNIQYANFPSLYQASDQASLAYQRKYIYLMGFDLLSMLAGSILFVYNYESEHTKSYVYVISALLLLSATVLTFIIKIEKYEDTWYQGRALAESTKTLTWRYITCSENFENDLSQEVVEEKFIMTITELSKEFKDLSSRMNSKVLALPIITENIRQIRATTWMERKNLYLNSRIRDQKNWYSLKAEQNKWKQSIWFWSVIGAQFVSLCCAVYMILHPESNWNFVGFFTTLSSAAIAWLQLKQHQELTQAYTTAAQELNVIEELSFKVQSEESLRKFVLDSENAISREHTLWLVQRRK